MFSQKNNSKVDSEMRQSCVIILIILIIVIIEIIVIIVIIVIILIILIILIIMINLIISCHLFYLISWKSEKNESLSDNLKSRNASGFKNVYFSSNVDQNCTVRLSLNQISPVF